MISSARWVAAALFLVASESPVPDELRSFARSLPGYFSKIENIIARETITQTVLNDQSGTLRRRRVLVSDYQIAHLGEDPTALWEFRFVRSVDGRELPDVDRKIEDFFRLRHPSAEAERKSIVDLAAAESLPGCYWHNLTLVLLAFSEDTVENFDWSRKGGRFVFRQVRGLGIPEDLFDPKSPRHYPTGSIEFFPDGTSPSKLELEFRTDTRRIRMRFQFSPPSPPDSISLPLSYEVDADRITGLGFNPETRTHFDYSDQRRYSVETHEAAPLPAK
jgi:hypothetical protein